MLCKTTAQMGSTGSTDALFQEAFAQLDAVITTMHDATERILSIVEQQMDRQAHTAVALKALQDGVGTPEMAGELCEWNQSLGEDLTSIILALSFQDLTGQRIHTVREVLGTLQETALESHVVAVPECVSTQGAVLKGSVLKGPSDTTQAQADALLNSALCEKNLLTRS